MITKDEGVAKDMEALDMGFQDHMAEKEIAEAEIKIGKDNGSPNKWTITDEFSLDARRIG